MDPYEEQNNQSGNQTPIEPNTPQNISPNQSSDPSLQTNVSAMNVVNTVSTFSIKKIILIILGIVLLGAISFGGWYLFMKPNSQTDNVQKTKSNDEKGDSPIEATADWVEYGDGSGSVVGLMTNSGNQPIAPSVVLEYVAADGEASSRRAYRGKRYLMPGETAHFAVWLGEKPQSFEVLPEFKPASVPAETPKVSLQSDDLKIGEYRHTGRVVNNGAVKAIGVAVGVTYFDAAGNVLAVAEVGCAPADLAPGGVGDFVIALGSEAPLVDRVEVNVDSLWLD